MTGSTILQGSTSNHIIDMSLLDSGIYFVNIFSEGIGHLTQKIVKGNH